MLVKKTRVLVECIVRGYITVGVEEYQTGTVCGILTGRLKAAKLPEPIYTVH